MPVYIHCRKCGAPNDEVRRREGSAGALPAYRCGYCAARFTTLRVLPEPFRVDAVPGEANRFRLSRVQ